MSVVVKPKAPPPSHWPAFLGPAVGRSDDFFVLGYSPELDEEQKQTDPDHNAFTFVFRYRAGARTTVERFPRRLEDLWQTSKGTLLAIGAPKGIIEITPAGGATELILPFVTLGDCMAIWGVNDDHVFAVGGLLDEPYALYRRSGKWELLPLPADTLPLFAVGGFHEKEVYFVGDQGQILLWDGRKVSRLKVPTTRNLVAVVRLNDKHMCAAGHHGTLLIGRGNHWRAVPTQVNDEEILSLAPLTGKVYFGADGGVWSFDGRTRPKKALSTPADWVSGLGDGLVVVDADQAWLYHAGKLTPLDTVI
jgi:hypothetical protein